MSESRPVFRFTQGEWAKHPSYDFKPMDVELGLTKWTAISVPFGVGEMVIGEVQYRVGDDIGGWPSVGDIDELKANLALISAAPNMLKYLAERLNDYDDGNCPSTADHERLRAIIAKATTY